MGNTVSKVVDFGLKATCYATGGLLGKSSEGFHFGPLRIKKDSIGVKFNFGICSVGLTYGRNEFGKMGIDASVSCGIRDVCSWTVRAGIDTDGIYGGLSSTVKLGPVKANANYLARSDGFRSYSSEVSGPGMSTIKYSQPEGLSVDIGGVNVDENLEMDCSRLMDNMAERVGKKAREKHNAYREKQENKDKKKNESELKDQESKNEKNNSDSEKKGYINEKKNESDGKKDKTQENKMMLRKRKTVAMSTDEKKSNSEEDNQIKKKIYLREEGKLEYCSLCNGPCKEI
jgi:hypothetical protein